jgi:hypothetical protein
MGSLNLIMGISLFSSVTTAEDLEFVVRRYGASPGEAIDRGALWIAAGVVMGLLAKIANRPE